MKINTITITQFIATHRVLLLLLGFTLGLFTIRVWSAQSLHFAFLVWNLFLAGLPLLLSQLARSLEGTSQFKGIILISIPFWLFFLPNSFYLITDLIHLHDPESHYVWFDLFMVFVFAVCGIYMGLLSLYDIRIVLLKIIAHFWVRFWIIMSCILSGFGVYVGRFLRYNSWDLFTRPNEVISGMITSLSEITTWWMTLGFGVFIWILLQMQGAKK